MKKNLLSVAILALLVVNLALTSILMFTIYPQAKKANELIVAVCNAIQLDLNSGSANGLGNIPVNQIAWYHVNGGADMTINLSGGGYAVVQVSVALNKESETYKKGEATLLTEQEAIIKDSINDIIRKNSKTEFDDNLSDIKKEITKNLQNTFGADYVIGISFQKNMTSK